jgi:hypothetical protein
MPLVLRGSYADSMDMYMNIQHQDESLSTLA